jgi:hypothetical protein
MSVRGLVRKVERLEVLAGRIRQEAPALERLRADPVGTLAAAGLDPDTWQIDVLTSHADRVLLLGSRQSGKSTVSAAFALLVALLQPGSLVLLPSPSTRQSGELLRKVVGLFNQFGCPVPWPPGAPCARSWPTAPAWYRCRAPRPTAGWRFQQDLLVLSVFRLDLEEV